MLQKAQVNMVDKIWIGTEIKQNLNWYWNEHLLLTDSVEIVHKEQLSTKTTYLQYPAHNELTFEELNIWTIHIT